MNNRDHYRRAPKTPRNKEWDYMVLDGPDLDVDRIQSHGWDFLGVEKTAHLPAYHFRRRATGNAFAIGDEVYLLTLAFHPSGEMVKTGIPAIVISLRSNHGQPYGIRLLGDADPYESSEEFWVSQFSLESVDGQGSDIMGPDDYEDGPVRLVG